MTKLIMTCLVFLMPTLFSSHIVKGIQKQAIAEPVFLIDKLQKNENPYWIRQIDDKQSLDFIANSTNTKRALSPFIRGRQNKIKKEQKKEIQGTIESQFSHSGDTTTSISKEKIESRTSSSKSAKESIEFKSYVSLKGVKNTLLEAVEELKNNAHGRVLITSAHRHWGGKNHRIGKALDFHYNEDFIDFLLSEEGEKILNKYNLEFFIEDNKRKTFSSLPPAFQTKWRFVPWATNIHIHMNMR